MNVKILAQNIVDNPKDFTAEDIEKSFEDYAKLRLFGEKFSQTDYFKTEAETVKDEYVIHKEPRMVNEDFSRPRIAHKLRMIFFTFSLSCSLWLSWLILSRISLGNALISLAGALKSWGGALISVAGALKSWGGALISVAGALKSWGGELGFNIYFTFFN